MRGRIDAMNMWSQMRNSHVAFLSTSIITATLTTRQWEWDRHPRLILSDLILHLHLHKSPVVEQQSVAAVEECNGSPIFVRVREFACVNS